jgi:hypothetical protein
VGGGGGGGGDIDLVHLVVKGGGGVDRGCADHSVLQACAGDVHTVQQQQQRPQLQAVGCSTIMFQSI